MNQLDYDLSTHIFSSTSYSELEAKLNWGVEHQEEKLDASEIFFLLKRVERLFFIELIEAPSKFIHIINIQKQALQKGGNHELRHAS